MVPVAIGRLVLVERDAEAESRRRFHRIQFIVEKGAEEGPGEALAAQGAQVGTVKGPEVSAETVKGPEVQAEQEVTGQEARAGAVAGRVVQAAVQVGQGLAKADWQVESDRMTSVKNYVIKAEKDLNRVWQTGTCRLL